MTRRNQRSLRGDRGQGMTEYIIVVALVAIATIGIVTAFGGNLRSVFGVATGALAGDTSATSHAQAPPAAALQARTLSNFGHAN